MAKVDSIRSKMAGDGWALLPLRLISGFGFAAHGFAKLARGPEHFAPIVEAMGIPGAVPVAWATVLLELVGGTGLMLGALVVPLCVPLGVIMITALLRVHLPYGFSSVRLRSLTAAGAEFGPVGYELNLVYLAALLTLAFYGPGPLSVDRIMAARAGK
jgi:putative oxidoreductase